MCRMQMLQQRCAADKHHPVVVVHVHLLYDMSYYMAASATSKIACNSGCCHWHCGTNFTPVLFNQLLDRCLLC